MSVEFVKNASKVRVTKDGSRLASLSVDCSIIANPHDENLLLITNKIDGIDNREAVVIDWRQVTTPVVVSRDDLIDKLDTDFFFRVSPSGDGTKVLLGIYRIIATENGLNIDKKLTELGFDGVQSADGGLTGDWQNLGGF